MINKYESDSLTEVCKTKFNIRNGNNLKINYIENNQIIRIIEIFKTV